MKKSNYISFLVFLLVSIVFISCGKSNKYRKQIKTADSLFTIKSLEEAKISYTKALQLKKDETYPKNQITKINQLLSEKAETAQYEKKIKEADIFFKNKEYKKAKTAYTEANDIESGNSYIKERLHEISKLTTKSKKPFHVIAGSYTLESNAIALQKKLAAKKRKSTIVKSKDGNYLVSLNSLETINKAYNYLITLEDDFDTSIWVFKI